MRLLKPSRSPTSITLRSSVKTANTPSVSRRNTASKSPSLARPPRTAKVEPASLSSPTRFSSRVARRALRVPNLSFSMLSNSRRNLTTSLSSPSPPVLSLVSSAEAVSASTRSRTTRGPRSTSTRPLRVMVLLRRSLSVVRRRRLPLPRLRSSLSRTRSGRRRRHHWS